MKHELPEWATKESVDEREWIRTVPKPGKTYDKLQTEREKQKKKFLAATSRGDSAYHTSKWLGLSRYTHYKWCERDENYRALYKKAVEKGMKFKEEMYRKEKSGDKEPRPRRF